MFAVIQTGGKQYLVRSGDKIRIEKLDAKEGEVFSFDKILLVSDGEKTEIGTPFISGKKVEGKVLRQARNKKVIVFRYHNKTRYRKKKGHRQHFSEVEISDIS